MLIKLSWKDRKVISEVAKFYSEMALHGQGYEDRIRQFWRISMYVKVALLSRRDVETVLVAMEAFYNMYKDSPSYKDPNGVFLGMEETIPRLKMLLEKKEKKQQNTSVSTE